VGEVHSGILFEVSLMLDSESISLVLLFLLTLILLLPLFSPRGEKRRLDIFSPVYLVSGIYGVIFVARPLYLIMSRGSSLLDWKTFDQALVYAAIGLFSFYLGYYWGLGRALAQVAPRLAVQWNRARLSLVLIIFVVISLVSLFIMEHFVVGVGLGYHLTHLLKVTFSYLMSKALPLIWGMLYMRNAFWLLFAWAISQPRLGIASKILLLILLTASILIAALTGLRGPILQVVMVPVIVYHYYRKPINLKSAIPLFFVFAFSLGILEHYRSLGQWLPSESLFSFTIRKFLDTFVVFDNFVLVLQHIPKRLGFLYGIPYLNLIFFPIPRAIWPGKPIYVDQILTRELISVGPELNTFTILGDFYSNFSWLGIIVGMLSWGVMWRVLYSYLIRNQKRPGAILIYAMAATLGFTSVRASFIEFVTVWGFQVLPVALAIIYIGRPKTNKKSVRMGGRVDCELESQGLP